MSTQLAVATSSVTLNLPSVSDGYFLDIIAYYTASGGTTDTGVCPNGDTNIANYYHQTLFGLNVTANANQAGLAGGRLGFADNSPIVPTMGKATIGDYRSATLQKTMICAYGAPNSGTAGAGYMLNECCLWKNTSTITQLTFVTNSGATFNVGSRFNINIIR